MLDNSKSIKNYYSKRNESETQTITKRPPFVIHRDTHTISAKTSVKKNNANNEDDNNDDSNSNNETTQHTQPKVINSHKLEEITERCDASFELLNGICEQIKKIIEYKKKKQSSSSGGNDYMFSRQLVGYMQALDNLVKINNGVEKAAAAVQKLCKQAQKMLGRGYVAKKGTGMSLGSSSIENEGEDDDDDSR